MPLNDVLTKQEQTVLLLVAKGWRNARIAQELFISQRTVESHLYRIFDKLGVSSRTEAALYIMQNKALVTDRPQMPSDNSTPSIMVLDFG